MSTQQDPAELSASSLSAPDTQAHREPPSIYFCDGDDRSELRSRHALSAETKLAVRALHVLDRRWNFVIVLHYALWLTSASIAVHSGSFIVRLAMALTGGLALSTLSVLAHEASHNLFTHRASIDRWFGFFAGLPVLFSAAGYRVMHPLHHKYLRSERDPDDIENVSHNSRVLRFLYLFVFTAAVYLYLITVPVNGYRHGTRAERRAIVLELLAMTLIAAAACALLPAQVVFVGWVLPLLVAGQVANIRGLAEHGLTSAGNELINARTVTSAPALSFLMCNINYHLEHHLYPGVPWYNLPRLHVLLRTEEERAGASVYPGYGAFLRDVARVLIHGVTPGRRLIPAHIREHVCV